MTPEERQRTMDFIVASQARLAAAQEQDRHDRLVFEEWSKQETEKLDRLLERQAHLLENQAQILVDTSEMFNRHSQRMDRMDSVYEESLNLQRETLEFQRQALHLLHMILDRLAKPDRPN